MREDGSGRLYVDDRSTGAAVNDGVSILDRADGVRIDPFYLGAKDESAVRDSPARRST